MATPKEKMQEVANRGLQGRYEPEKRAKFDEAVKRGLITLPEGSESTIKGLPGTVGSTEFLAEANKSQDLEFNYSGVPRFGLRAFVDSGDTDPEKEANLAKRVGVQNVVRDSNGLLGITPEGATKLGLDSKGLNMTLEGRSPMELEDLADVRGEAPAAVGATLASIATAGVAAVPAAMTVMGAAAASKAIDETVEQLSGNNLQPPNEVAQDIKSAGVLGATEEIGGRAVIRLMRKVAKPNARSLMDGAEQAMADAEAIGIVPKIANLKDDPIFKRIQGLLDTVLGDRNQMRNISAFKVEMERLTRAFNGRTTDPETIGQIAKQGRAEAHKDFSDIAQTRFAVVDEMLGGQEIIRSEALRKQSREFLKNFGTDQQGNPIAINPTDLALLQKLANHSDTMTTRQWQTTMTDLIDRAEDTTGLPGIGKGRARKLIKSMNEAFDDAINAQNPQGPGNSGNAFDKRALELMKDARKWYGVNIQKFDNATARKLAKGDSDVGNIPDDEVLSFILKKGNTQRANELKELVGPERWKDIQAATMDRIFETQDVASINPLDKIFDGTVLRKSLDSFGRKGLAKDADRVLANVLGEEHVGDLRKLATSLELASSLGNTSGGLIAAMIAVRPIKNFGKIVQMTLMRRFLTNPKNIKWLTTGIRHPKTEAGVKALTRVSAQMSDLIADHLRQQGEVKQAEAAQQAAAQQQQVQ